MTTKSKKDITDIGKSIIIVVLTLIITGIYAKFNTYATVDYVDKENKTQDKINAEAHKNIIEDINGQNKVLTTIQSQILDLWKREFENKSKEDGKEN